MELFVLWFGLCIAVGLLASKRGRSGIGWFLFAFILSPILGFIFVLVLERKNKTRNSTAEGSSLRNCPDCRELIRSDAKKCKHCGSEVIPLCESQVSYPEDASKLAHQIQAGRDDISDYIKLLRGIGYECTVNGVFKETYDIKVGSEALHFDAQEPLKKWVNERVIPRVIAREEITV